MRIKNVENLWGNDKARNQEENVYTQEPVRECVLECMKKNNSN
jgi:hypothetical protein